MEIASFSIETLLFLFFIAIAAGLLDTLAGGGGLLALPALIMSGVPPLNALATNKLQGSMGTGTSTFMMLKKKKIHWHNVKYLMLSAFIGSVVGTVFVQFIDVAVLSFIIPVVLVIISFYFLFSKTPQDTSSQPKLSIKKYRNTVLPTIGAYDGMFGPGTGSFFTFAGISCRGLDLLSSTANAKALNFSTNIASLIVFIIAGQVFWLVGFVMMCGQVIGAWLGSHCLFTINPKYLRILVVVMCMSMLVKYFSNLI